MPRRMTRTRSLQTITLVAISWMAGPNAPGQQSPISGAAEAVNSRIEFAHPPLRYRGPDPTANYFIPTSAGFVANDEQLPSPSEVLPELDNPIGLPAYQDGRFDFGSTSHAPIGAWPDETAVFDPVVGGRHISDQKNGFFQKAAFSAAYIDRGSIDSFGINEIDFSVSVAVPAPTREWPMLITPTFNLRLIDGPNTPMVPARLYETYVDFLWVPRLSPRWTAIIGVAPSLYTDFEVGDSDAFRLTGKALARFDWVPDRLQLIFGVLYLNREDIALLPAGGLIWNPNLDARYELIFPKPKLARRIAVGSTFEDWIYLAAEFGGNSWVYDRGGIVETVTFRDYRILVGLERKMDGGAGYRIEVGYVFSRTAEFQSGIPDASADDTAIVRGGLTY